VEEPTTCKSGALTLDGGRSSSIKENNSSTSKTTRFLTLKVVRMKKDTQLEFGPTMEETTKSGLLFTLIRLKRLRRRDSTRTLASIEIDHSTSDQDFQ
jgi:hypothetical protein